MACPCTPRRGSKHLVQEEGVVQGEAESDGVRHDQVFLGDFRRVLVVEPGSLTFS
eukprot:CAMPEP_0175542976 /NCGR_PEP_ID=MMETSP0096-20121207/28038_1 /TAXON_ID=311494 /ORGANISM="Alexandrium monilatum, Strain CCMP3105" /LENGTH=54 /DNA_ID=CAMNT_0016845913 /DNA_START=42 /DNA_END=206 /DNA_ORIENTATION=+